MKRLQPAPLLIDLLAVAAIADCSKRKAREISREAWFPPAVRLGPRVVRWSREAVVDALLARGGAVPAQAEPEPLRRSRNESNSGRREKQVGEVGKSGI